MSEVAEQTTSIFRVMPENVTPVWPQVGPMLERALMLTSVSTAEDVRRQLASQQSQLWVQVDSETQEIQAACVTEFINYPVGLFVRVFLAAAGDGTPMDTDGLFETLNLWRRANRCVGFEAGGRTGWLRRIPEARFEGVVMRLIFKDEEPR